MPNVKIFSATLVLVLTMLACATFAPTPLASPTNPIILESTPVPTSTQDTSTQYVIVEPTFPPTRSSFPSTEAEVPRVSLEQALTAYTAGAAVFVDVRSKPAYDASHIAGAIYIPLADIENNLDLGLDKDEWIITYCT